LLSACPDPAGSVTATRVTFVRLWARWPTAAGRLDQVADIARELLAKPLPSVAEDRLRSLQLQ
jgi:hypothetical protein